MQKFRTGTTKIILKEKMFQYKLVLYIRLTAKYKFDLR